jgi:hypothetical protein
MADRIHPLDARHYQHRPHPSGSAKPEAGVGHLARASAFEAPTTIRVAGVGHSSTGWLLRHVGLSRSEDLLPALSPIAR